MRAPACVVLALALTACGGDARTLAWPTLLEPLRVGAEVSRGYVLAAPTRGSEHDLVLRAVAPSGAQVEVHVLDRGRWSGVRETRSYGVAWEEPHTTAPRDDAEAVTARITDALAAHDHGLPRVDDVALDARTASPWRARALRLLGAMGSWRVVPWWTLAVVAMLWSLTRVRDAHRASLALTALALSLRVVFASWGPFHINGQGPLWIDGARHPEELRAYGPGYAELHLLARVFAPDRAVFAMHLALSSLTPALVALAALRAGASRRASLVVGVVCACAPSLVRIATTESYLTPLIAFALASAACALTPATERVVRVVSLLASALFAVACARIHPLASVALAPVVLVVLAARGVRDAMRVSLTVALALWLTSGSVLADVLRAVGDGTVAGPSLWRPAGWAALALAPMLAWRRTRSWTPVAALTVASISLVAATFAQSDTWRAAALHVALWPVAILVAIALPRALTASASRALATSAALGVAVFAQGASTLREHTTDQDEYRLTRAWIASLPPRCTVRWVAFAGPRRTVFLPTWAGDVTAVRLDARGPVDVRALRPRTGCAVYLHTSACDSPDGRAACERVERALDLGPPWREAVVPARASHRWLPYAASTVHLRAWRLDPAPAAPSAPAP